MISREEAGGFQNYLSAINHNVNEDRAVIKTYLGAENRKDALRDADFVVNAIQVGGYEPCTVTDFEIPKKYGIKQTIADTLGIGGIMRALRTIPVLEEFARDMEEVSPEHSVPELLQPIGNAYRLYASVYKDPYCRPLSQRSGLLQKLLEGMGMEDKIEGRTELIAGINTWRGSLRSTTKTGMICIRRSQIAEEKNTSVKKDMRTSGCD